MRHHFIAILLLAAVIAAPLMLRRKSEEHHTAGRQLVIISPHNEGIRYEIEMAFRDYYLKKHGEEISIDWRIIGGTSEIVRYIRSNYLANFGAYWRGLNKECAWDDSFGAAVFSPRTVKGHPAFEARSAFLSGDCSIGIDLFYGGGQYDANGLSQAGILVKSGVKTRHPEWFEAGREIYPEGGGGEIWHDRTDTYYATCYSTFGMISNCERLAQAGFTEEEIRQFGHSWRDLADSRLYQSIGIADPSQSGSITKCFEMLIQYEMQQDLAEAYRAGRTPTADELDHAWRTAMTLVKTIGGNASYLTFSASKVPSDAATGQIAAGMCIDTYGRSQASWHEKQLGRQLLAYHTPDAGSTVSADPIGILRGAPHRQDAEEFMDFVLSYRAQKLVGLRSGTAGGPRKYDLYRLPASREFYIPENLKYSTATENPFTLSSKFTYHPELTAPLFNLIRSFIKVMIIDCGPELRACQGRIIRAGGLQRLSEEQREAFEALPFEFRDAREILKKADTPEKQATLFRSWIEFFRGNYLRVR